VPTCDNEPPPPPGSPVARYEVSATGFNNLHAADAEDGSGSDEIYFKINGFTVFGPMQVYAGPYSQPTVNFTYTFDTGLTQSPSFYISMFDDDWPDADEKLGGHQITRPAMAVGQWTLTTT
jgi:hypothetical protein